MLTNRSIKLGRKNMAVHDKHTPEDDPQGELLTQIEKALPAPALGLLESAEARYFASVNATTVATTVTTTTTT
jgi:hypothetical protein